MIFLTLRQIIFKGKLRSKPVRENFQDIENGVNDIQNQINGLTTPPAGNEVTNARDNCDVLRDNIRLRKGFGNKININNAFQIVPHTTPTDKIMVKAGAGIVNGIGCIRGYGVWSRVGTTITMTELSHNLTTGMQIYVDVSSDASALPEDAFYSITKIDDDTFTIVGINTGATSGTAEYSRLSGSISVCSTGYKRIDLVVLNSDNTISILSGTEVLAAATYIWPTITESQLALGSVEIGDSGPVITSSEIDDRRILPLDIFKYIEYSHKIEYNYTDGVLTSADVTDAAGAVVTFDYTYNSLYYLTDIDVTIDGIDFNVSFTYGATGYLTKEERFITV